MSKAWRMRPERAYGPFPKPRPWVWSRQIDLPTRQGVKMADIRKFSERTIDLAERLADVADAVEGKNSRRDGMRAKWLILPAAGAGLYALVTSGFFTRQAKEVLDGAKSRASELPDDLARRTGDFTDRQKTGGQQSSGGKRTQTSRTRSSGKASRKTPASR
jgi:hypothetical protein